MGDELAALRADDLAVIEKHAPRLRVVPEHQRARQPRVLDRLNCVEHADGCQIAGEGGFVGLSLGRRRRLAMQLRMARAANCFQAGADRDALVERLCFQQTIVRGVEIVALDVQTRQRQTMPRGFLRVLVRRGHFAHAFAQRDRPRISVQRRAHTLQRPIRRAVLEEQLGIEQGRLDFANRFFVIVAHECSGQYHLR